MTTEFDPPSAGHLVSASLRLKCASCIDTVSIFALVLPVPPYSEDLRGIYRAEKTHSAKCPVCGCITIVAVALRAFALPVGQSGPTAEQEREAMAHCPERDEDGAIIHRAPRRRLPSGGWQGAEVPPGVCSVASCLAPVMDVCRVCGALLCARHVLGADGGARCLKCAVREVAACDGGPCCYPPAPGELDTHAPDCRAAMMEQRLACWQAPAALALVTAHYRRFGEVFGGVIDDLAAQLAEKMAEVAAERRAVPEFIAPEVTPVLVHCKAWPECVRNVHFECDVCGAGLCADCVRLDAERIYCAACAAPAAT